MKQTTDLKCPICNSTNIRADYDYPETMRCCKSCGADFHINGDIILDPREPKETSISKDSLEFGDNGNATGGRWKTNSYNCYYVETGYCTPVIGGKNGVDVPIEIGQIFGRNKEESIANAAIICEAVNNYNALKDIAKQVHFWFNNEANYPEGTNGYRIAKQIESILPNLK